MTLGYATDAEIEQMLIAQHKATLPVEETPKPPNPAPPRPLDLRKKQFEPFAFDNVFDLFYLVHPDVDLYEWQVEEQLRLSGYLDPRGQKVQPTAHSPLKYSVWANNNAGKDSILVAPFAIWCILTKVRCRVVLTSASHLQLKEQTQKNIQAFCDDFNNVIGSKVLKYVDLKITCAKTGSEIILFATDMAGKAEGWHPIEPNADLVIILNEVKSVNEDIIKALLRCFGWSYWVEVSSSGLTGTHFHRTVTNAKKKYPEIPALGDSFNRQITDDMCPHISRANLQELIDECGGDENHPIVLSARGISFIQQDTVYIIPEHFFDYPPPVEGLLGDEIRSGLDLALGGDEAVLAVWKGNKQIAQEVWRERYEPTLHKLLIEAFNRHGLRADAIFADAGGLGLPIIQRLQDAGWNVNRVKNDEKAYGRVYKNRGTEIWWMFRRLIQDKLLIVPKDEKLIKQLKLRRYKITDNNVIQIEPKREAKARGEKSPDRADANVLAFAGISFADVKKLSIKTTTLRQGKYIIDMDNDPDEQIQNMMRRRVITTPVTYTSSILDTLGRN